MVMLSDHLCRIGWRSPPRSFVSLMTLYESNYIRLGWLIPDLHALEGNRVSRVSGDLSLYLEVLERGPYTLLFNLSYRFAGTGTGPEEVALPDMQVRVYHDARVAEAYSCADAPAPGSSTPLRGQLEQRWARNILLNKWLEYCAERGHRFTG